MMLTHEMETALASGAIAPRWLVWIAARNLATGQTEAAGFCTGEGDIQVMVDGQTRTYTGAGGMIAIDPLEYESGTTIQMRRASFSMVSPEVEAAVHQYDTRLAPAEIHLALFDPESLELIGTAKAFSGWVEEPDVSEGYKPTLTLGFASSARAGTKTLAAKKSPESQRKRAPTDKGRDYADMAGDVTIQWGGESEDGYFI